MSCEGITRNILLSPIESIGDQCCIITFYYDLLLKDGSDIFVQSTILF